MASDFVAFGAGDIIVIPAGTNPTPQRIGYLQEASIDISWETKELHGNKQFALAIARGKGKITGKAKTAKIDGALLASIMTGATSVTGTTIGVFDETTGTIAGATYTATNTTGFVDGGVKDENGNKLTRVAATPTATQYTVTSGGVYSFNAGATGKVYSVSYTYTSSSSGTTTTYTNQLMGSGATYQLGLYNTEPDGGKFGIKLAAVVFPKLSMAFKSEDFTMPELEFQAFADSSGNVFYEYNP